jgi:Pentapeptide repeats (8 copies)
MAEPRTNNTETLPTPIWGFAPPSPEPDTKKLDALLASLNGSAERFQTLWLQGADLGSARLQGANLFNARLQGSKLFNAQLQGAYLSFAQLQGAYLTGARLQGADLGSARLQGADLSGAQFQGARLRFAQLQAAYFLNANLQGADLFQAQLQGADLRRADLSDSDLDGIFVFRTDIGDANLATAAIRSIEADKVKPVDHPGKTEPLNEADVEGWIAAATQFLLKTEKADIWARFARLKPDFRYDKQEAHGREWRKRRARSIPTASTVTRGLRLCSAISPVTPTARPMSRALSLRPIRLGANFAWMR